MSNKGNSRHLKRLAASRFMGMHRKEAKYAAKPTPGRHTLAHSTSLLSILRDKLSYASNSAEAKHIIKKLQSITLNGRPVKDANIAVGYGDIIGILPTNEYYKVSVNKQGAVVLEKASSDAKRIGRIQDIYVVKGNKKMMRLHDGSVMPAIEGAKVNDSVVIANNKPESLLKFDSGATCFVYKGRHTSETGKIKEIIKGSAQSGSKVRVANDRGTFETLVENVIVIGA